MLDSYAWISKAFIHIFLYVILHHNAENVQQVLGTLSRAHSSAIYRIISLAFALEVIVQELLVQIKGTKQGVYHYEFKLRVP